MACIQTDKRCFDTAIIASCTVPQIFTLLKSSPLHSTYSDQQMILQNDIIMKKPNCPADLNNTSSDTKRVLVLVSMHESQTVT